ncbi:deoxyribodipyrimidine photo-lyase [Halobacteriovorax sp. HLS]|uniref:cryptochrome/photolyase family protein n=1 Tax=Halobacteriovorax sp. HLS TaxID=2234000 RepID=UPI000FD891B8|nr:deoxyribodipyrimidine photo-lyase [Halobacteriovorax sp. HLS]
MEKVKVNIFWFRRDLRLNDNRALYFALCENTPVIPIFIFDPAILDKLKDKEDARVEFILESLQRLKNELHKYGSDLEVFHDSPENVFSYLFKNYEIENIFSNKDYESFAITRDKRIQKMFSRANFIQYKDQCIFEELEIIKKDGTPYTVFTAYKNKWLEQITPNDMASINTVKKLGNLYSFESKSSINLSDLGHRETKISPPKRVIRKSKLLNYQETRDLPGINGTSNLSVHLRFGTISIRKCIQIAMETNKTWLSELIWRDFFMQILYNFPHVEKGPFKKKYEKIQWLNKRSEFKKWCDGNTGYPIVDAGMRELNTTGLMHNRVRMITASFLVKHLLIDWRWGEKYFAQKLLDYDKSANNGNWQWVAGTGCDASPYFRVFNPYTQQKKFDPEFKYIRKWVPEFDSEDYPPPMVDHSTAYHRAIHIYKISLNEAL